MDDANVDEQTEAAACRALNLHGSCSTRDSGSFATSAALSISFTVARCMERSLGHCGKANALSLRPKNRRKDRVQVMCAWSTNEPEHRGSGDFWKGRPRWCQRNTDTMTSSFSADLARMRRPARSSRSTPSHTHTMPTKAQ